MTYRLGQEVKVSGRVNLRDMSGGMPGVPVPYDFINAGGYTPTPITGTACDNEVKGKLSFFMFPIGPVGNPTDILIGGAPTPASDIPLRLYVAGDAFEPWFAHNGPTLAGTYRCQRIFTFANGNDEIIDEWTDNWY